MTWTTASRSPATLVVNGPDFVTVQGGPATVANTRLIQIFGMGGNDDLVWSRSANLPPALVSGGAGNDTLVGGAGNDIYRLDTDVPAGSDTIDEYGGGIDTLDFSSTTTWAVRIDLSNPAAKVINAGLTLTLSAGNTIENVTGGDFINPTGSHTDQLFGNGLNDVIVGGDGNDFIDGGAGDDILARGAGDDIFRWDPGDGSDTIDGQDGIRDELGFAGANVNESIAVSANGPRARLTRDVDGVAIDLNGQEEVDIIPQGGADTITVNDLTGTGVGVVNLALGVFTGPNTVTGDGQTDAVIVNGTNGKDNFQIIGSAVGSTALSVVGLSAQVDVIDSEPIDHLTVNALGGNDTVNSSGLDAVEIGLTVNLGGGQAPMVGDAEFEAPAVGAGTFGAFQYRPAGTPNAPEGIQVGFLQQTGSFSQTIAGLAAGTYKLSFQAAQRGNVPASRQDFQVLVDGAVVGTFTPVGAGYSTLTTAAFTVAAGAHTISFVGLDSVGGDNTALLDNVQLTQ